MKPIFYLLISIAFGISNCSIGQTDTAKKEANESILKIEMTLSAFGVESDDFPSIDALIDISRDSSYCKKWFYSPANKDSVYSLTKEEMQSILTLLKIRDLEKLKKEYDVQATDQPRSTTVIYTTKNKFIIDDYGLIGDHPLQKLYKIVYKY
jgi:hypothetical protein